jgi:cytochrome c oxidase subunit IV
MSQTITLQTYTRIFIALMVLLVFTVAAVYIPFDRWHMPGVGIALAFAIATVKATLVVLYFMHIKGGSPLARLFIIAVLVWLGILFVITYSDYFTRSWLPVSESWTEPTQVERPAHP